MKPRSRTSRAPQEVERALAIELFMNSPQLLGYSVDVRVIDPCSTNTQLCVPKLIGLRFQNVERCTYCWDLFFVFPAIFSLK